MKIQIKNKTIEIPVTSSLYRDIKAVLVEAATMPYPEDLETWKKKYPSKRSAFGFNKAEAAMDYLGKNHKLKMTGQDINGEFRYDEQTHEGKNGLGVHYFYDSNGPSAVYIRHPDKKYLEQVHNNIQSYIKDHA